MDSATLFSLVIKRAIVLAIPFLARFITYRRRLTRMETISWTVLNCIFNYFTIILITGDVYIAELEWIAFASYIVMRIKDQNS